MRARSATLAEIGLALLRIKEQRDALTPIDEAVDRVMLEIDADGTAGADPGSTRQQVKGLLENRRDLLNQAAAAYTSYLTALGDVDTAQRRLLDVVAEYEQFLDRHLL